MKISTTEFSSSEQMENEKLLNLYCLSCAPFTFNGFTCLQDESLSKKNHLNSWISDLNRLNEFMMASCELITSSVKLYDIQKENINSEEPTTFVNKYPEKLSFVILCSSALIKRITSLNKQLSHSLKSILDDISPDAYQLSHHFNEMIKSNSNISSNQLRKEIMNYIDLSSNNDWTPLDFSTKPRVEFKDSTEIISDEYVGTSKLISISNKRSTHRHATGYSQFNFKDPKQSSKISDIEDDVNSDCDEETLTKDNFRNNINSIPNRYSMKSDEVITNDESYLTSCTQQNLKNNSKNDTNNSGDNNFPGLNLHNQQILIIQDSDGDPEWENTKRHFERNTRIRSRIPTGKISTNSRKLKDSLNL